MDRISLRRRLLVLALLAGALFSERASAQRPLPLETLAESYLWPADAASFERASSALASDASLENLTRNRFHDLEEVIRRGRTEFPPPPRMAYGEYLLDEIEVELPDGRRLPVLVQLPPHYHPKAIWPALLAMHGGPPGSVEQARRGAERMIRVWKEAAAEAGWIVLSPAMTTVVSVGERTEDRLPYEILHPEQMEAILAEGFRRYRIDPNRIVSTGISLGSNFSIAFAGSRPDRFAAIVPVSTEGDSREHLLRNLKHVAVYVLEGTRDTNIRTIEGPQAFASILTSFGYDVTYREFSDRAHEGFQEHYPDVLRWLAARPRNVYPREVLRVPHSAIVPVSRRVHWIEPDTRQALVRAEVAEGNRIDITARWARTIRVYLHDRLVNLDEPVEIRVNGAVAHQGQVSRSARFALEEVRRLGDPGRIFAAAVEVEVPDGEESTTASRALSDSLAPRHPEGTLSFWEMYATRALDERFPSLGIQGEEVREAPGVALTGEQVAIRVTSVEPGGPFSRSGIEPGDVLLEVDGEPFFAGRGLSVLRSWLVRELRSEPRSYPVVIWREDARRELEAPLSLGPYVGSSSEG